MKKKLLLGLFLMIVLLSCAVFVGCKSPKALSAPQNLEFTDRLLTWEKVEGAIGYAVLVGDREYETTDTSLEILDITAGNYIIEVMAIGDGKKYVNSQMSESISFNLLPGAESGSDETGWYYTMLEDGTGYEVRRGENIQLINHPHIEGDIKIPDFFGDYPVKRIESEAFAPPPGALSDIVTGYECNITTTGVELPKYLETIGSGAFMFCIALESIYIPDGVIIEGCAFESCISLKSVRLPGDLVEIPYSAFVDTKLDSLELPPTLEKIGSSAFRLGKHPHIPEELYIESGLTSLEIPASVRSIGESAFRGRENLKDITVLSTELELFDAFVFRDTAWEKSQPDGWTYLREDILYSYKGEMPQDAALTVPSVKYIAGGAFFKCENLKKVVLPEGVKLVGESTFGGCSALEEVVLPKDLPSVPALTFNGCTSLKDLSFFLNKFYDDNLHMVFYYCTAIEEITIPAGVTTLEYTFGNCTGLKKVTLPEGIKELKYTFGGCTSLSEINLPEGLETLDATFNGCRSLREIVLPGTLKTIGNDTFAMTGLSDIILPESLEEISSDPFRRCNELKSIYYEGSLKEFKNKVFNYASFLENKPQGSIVYYYSETEPTTAGNYWRYVDGQAVAWETAAETTALQEETKQYTFAQLPAIVKEEN